MSRAFSLVEVLIAILVLALGLLGLGAVFPAVISEQRRSFDSINGESIARQVEDMMRRGNELVDLSPLRQPSFGRLRGAEDGDSVRPTPLGAPDAFDFLWVMDNLTRIDGGANSPWDGAVPGASNFGDFQRGVWRVNSNENRIEQILPVSARLHPQPNSGLDPRFVWDVVARRTPAGSVEMAVFVRRTDDRIRPVGNATLADTLTGSNTQPVLPLALDVTNGRLTVPTANTANQAYPAPQSLSAYVDDRQLSWLIFPNAGGTNLDTSLGFVRRVGQQLVDNNGVVRTVIAIPQPRAGEPLGNLASQAVVVHPPFTRTEASNRAPQTARPGQSAEEVRRRATWVRQVVFTPQPPVAVRVFTLDKE